MFTSLTISLALQILGSSVPAQEGTLYVACPEKQHYCEATGTSSGEIRICFDHNMFDDHEGRVVARQQSMHAASEFCDVYVIGKARFAPDIYPFGDAAEVRKPVVAFAKDIYEVYAADGKSVGELSVFNRLSKFLGEPEQSRFATISMKVHSLFLPWSIWDKRLPYKFYRGDGGWRNLGFTESKATVKSCRADAAMPCAYIPVDVVHDADMALMLSALMGMHLQLSQ